MDITPASNSAASFVCPFCAEAIQRDAKKCKHCNEFLDEKLKQQRQGSHSASTWHPGVAAILSFIIPGAGQIYKGQLLEGFLSLVITLLGYLFFIVPGLIMHIAVIYSAYTQTPAARPKKSL